MSGDVVLDTAVLDRLRQLTEEGEPDFVAEVLTLFLGDVPARLAAVDDALASGDPHALERAAHALKGAAANIGARRLQAVCHRVEQQSRGGDVAGTAPDVAALRAEVDTLSREIHCTLGD